MDSDTVVREMALPDVLAAQDLLQRAFGDAVRQRTGRLAGPPFGPRLAMVRFQKEPPGAFIALRGGRVVGCVFSVRWGSLAYFGPIAVAPEAQRLGIAQRLINAVHGRWRRARVRLWGLECIGDAAQLVYLYTKMAYLPVSNAVAFVADATADTLPRGFSVVRFGELATGEREAALRHIKRIAAQNVPGLDPTVEVTAALETEIGDTLLVHNRRGIVGFAVAHWTPLLRADGLAIPVAAVSRAGGTRGTAALLRGLRTLALERQLAHVWIRVAARRVKAQDVLKREGFRADQARLRMKHGRDEERSGQLLFDSWL